MTPPRLDADVVAARLTLISRSLDELEALRGATAERLTDEPLTRAAVERLVQVIVDLAVDVNVHIVSSALGVVPDTGRSSFEAAARAGALPADLAERLAPTAGLRDILVHRYADIRVDVVAESIPAVLDEYRDYVREIAAYTRSRSS